MFTPRLFLAAAAAAALAAPAVAGGAAPAGNIVAAASSSPDFKTLVAAVKAAKLVDTLASKGPFTVFAPTNDAFAKIDAATLQNLLKPENRDQLTKILTYHVVPGKLNAAYILQQIEAGGGQATLTTVEGSQLTARLQGGNVILVDESNRTSTVTKTDLMQSNGIIHVIDTVVLPS
ncbi:MAG TPA: fasciclin domain-containing protein [Sphingomicrobium sp.]